MGCKMSNPCVLCVFCVRSQLLGTNCALDALPQTAGKGLIVPGAAQKQRYRMRSESVGSDRRWVLEPSFRVRPPGSRACQFPTCGLSRKTPLTQALRIPVSDWNRAVSSFAESLWILCVRGHRPSIFLLAPARGSAGTV